MSSPMDLPSIDQKRAMHPRALQPECRYRRGKKQRTVNSLANLFESECRILETRHTHIIQPRIPNRDSVHEVVQVH